ALTAASPGRGLRLGSLRGAAPAIGLAILWVVLQTAGEITVTDLAVVRTFAEDDYTQLVTACRDALGRAIAVALPASALAIVVAGTLVRRWESRLAVAASARPSLVVPLGSARWAVFGLILVALSAYAAVPVISLVRQAAGGEAGSVSRLMIELRRAVHVNLS